MTTLMEKVAEVDPDTYQFLTNTAPAIQTSPFRDEIVQEMDDIIKHAAAMNTLATRPGVAGAAGRFGGQMALSVGGGIAMALAGDMYEAAKRGLTKSRNYRDMLDANPDLKKMPKDQVMKHFNILHQFNPEFSSNPTVAGAFVRKNAQFPEFDIKQLGDLVSSRRNIQDSRKLPDPHMKLTDVVSEGDGMHPLEQEEKRLKNEGQKMRNSQSALELGRTMADKGAPGYSELGMGARAKIQGHTSKRKK